MRARTRASLERASIRVGAALAASVLSACGAPAAATTPAAAPAPAPAPTPALLVGDVPYTPEEVERLFEFSPLPDAPDDPTNAHDLDPRAARLGQFLFYDRRLSRNGEIACATCHDPAKGWTDGRRQAMGLVPLPRHSMTLWNAAHQRWFFWDGRRDSLWAQALTPLEEAREHGLTRLEIVRSVAADPGLARAYEDVFGPLPEVLTGPGAAALPERARPVPGQPEHADSRAWAALPEATRQAVDRVFSDLGKAIAAFERNLVAGRSPFDVFVEGVREADPVRQQAVGDDVRRGFLLFVGKGRCHVCHSGPTFSDLEFHDDRVPPYEAGDESDSGRFGGVREVLADPFNGLGAFSDAPDDPCNDKLRYLVRRHENLAEFKTPSLRNVAVTGPYMHQGQIPTLEEVVEFYSTLERALPVRHERKSILQPAGFTESEKQDLLAFLRALTDTRIDPALTRPPDSPFLPAGAD